MKNQVWCEQNEAGHVTRILRDNHEVFRPSSVVFYTWERAEAVSSIRHQLFRRSKGYCELCGEIITEQGAQMHEQHHRGKGGEISMDNSVFICSTCHKRAHADRNPHWSKK